MPKWRIYLSDEVSELVEEARRVSGLSASAIFSQAIRRILYDYKFPSRIAQRTIDDLQILHGILQKKEEEEFEK